MKTISLTFFVGQGFSSKNVKKGSEYSLEMSLFLPRQQNKPKQKKILFLNVTLNSLYFSPWVDFTNVFRARFLYERLFF